MFTITTHHVRDKVAFVEGNEKLVLYVDVDPLGFVAEMQKSVSELKSLNDNSTDEEFLSAAKDMAVKMFGEDQAQKLIEFYHCNPKQLFNVTSRYFIERLNGLISAKQKKLMKKKLIG